VWDHIPTGLRVHVGGAVCRLPVTICVHGMWWSESRNVDQCIRIAGGNRRRGVMMWSLNVLRRMRRESTVVKRLQAEADRWNEIMIAVD